MASFTQLTSKSSWCVWYYDCCLTNIELDSAGTETSQIQKVKEMDSKIDILTAKVSSLTDMLNPTKQGNISHAAASVQNASDDLWNNPSKVAILKSSLGVRPDLKQLEARILGDNIKVTDSKRNNNGDVVITCPSTTTANKIKELASELLPNHTVKDPQVNYSWINVVGFENNHDLDTVFDLLVKNNEYSFSVVCDVQIC